MADSAIPHEHHDHTTDAHAHAHAHTHDKSGLAGVLKSLFGLHSHDSADAIDSSLEKSTAGMRTVTTTMVMLLITAAAQGFIAWYSHSAGLLSDTLHNGADAMTAVPLWFAFRLSRRAPTKRFTYGFGKAEDIAGLCIIIIVAISAVGAGAVAIEHLAHPIRVTHLPLVALGAVIGLVGNEAVAQCRLRVGRRIGSAALRADGLHARADGVASALVLLGAGGAALGLRWADPVVGLLITLTIVLVLARSLRSVGQRMLDAVDPNLTTEITQVVTSCPGVLEVTAVHARWTGHKLRAEVRLSVDATIDVAAAHDIAELVHHTLLHEIDNLSDALIHVDPYRAGKDAHVDSSHHH